jgi:acyl-CoA reductase-like NAD-dependent aldehyde dehydrogenase
MSESYDIPLLRFGTAYDSLTKSELCDCRDGTVLATVSQANAGLITRDLSRVSDLTTNAFTHPIGELLERFPVAADAFLHASLPLGASATQTPEAYLDVLSASCGLPQSLCRANMQKIAHVLKTMPQVLRGLSRALNLEVIDRGMIEQNGVALSYLRSADVLGAILPNNSPGVNNLWLPATALKYPVALKPGRQDPWTPMRLIQALIHAGVSPSAFGYYPAGHDAAQRIMEGAGRALIFGDAKTVSRYANDPAVSVHGPGYSKVIVGEDMVDDIETVTQVIVDSIVRNGGRSCINASTIIVPRHADEIAESVAQRLVEHRPRALDDDDATLAGFISAPMGESINAAIDDALLTPGAIDVTARFRDAQRLETLEGLTYLHPALIRCEQLDHPLARTEYMFPFASLVELAPEQSFDWIGPTLAATILTDDAGLRRKAMACADIARLNLGALPTSSVEWDQPHEGNLFEFLYRRRAIQESR